MANITQTSNANAVKTFYEKQLLMRAHPRLIHGRFGRKATISKFGSLEWRRYAGLSAVTSALTEGTTPTEESAPSITLVTATPLFYGSWIGFTDEIDITSIDNVVVEYSAILGEQAGLSVDTLIRNAITAGATKMYAAGESARGNLAIGTNEISFDDFLRALAQLMGGNALPYANGRFMCIMHPDSWATLYQDVQFMNLFVREDPSPVRSGFVGSVLMCDIFVTANAREYADAGVNSTEDVYSLLFIGMEAYGVTGFTGLFYNEVDGGPEMGQPLTGQTIKPVDVIVKQVGSAGADDPLNQRGTAGWKVSLDNDVLNSAFIVDMEHLTINSGS
jgi:N4-gp56 family major capsid protein